MSPELRTPDERSCELCGRSEVWDEDAGTWRVASDDGDRAVGSLYCIHEWDINGSFVPFAEPRDAAEG
ncbi:MAG: HEWD family protein [Haloferacaceae archaeon]